MHLYEFVRACLQTGVAVDLLSPNAPLFDFNDRSAKFRFHRIARVPTASGPNSPPEFQDEVRASNEAVHDMLLRICADSSDETLIYERHSLWSYSPMESGLTLGIPTAIELNAPLLEEHARYRGPIDAAFAESVRRRAIEAAGKIVMVSEELALNMPIAAHRQQDIVVVPNGVDVNRFGATRSSGGGIFKVGFVGSFQPWHGIDVLLQAFRRFLEVRPSSKLVLIGYGPYWSFYRAMAEEMGLSADVIWTGAVEIGRIPEILSSLDVAVAPYPHMPEFYFSPLKILEYKASGLPIIASSLGQISRIIDDGVTGILIPPGDVSALASKLEHLSDDPVMRMRLGDAARSSAVKSHGWDRVITSIFNASGMGEPSHGEKAHI